MMKVRERCCCGGEIEVSGTEKECDKAVTAWTQRHASCAPRVRLPFERPVVRWGTQEHPMFEQACVRSI